MQTRQKTQYWRWIPVMGAIPTAANKKQQQLFLNANYLTWHVGWAIALLVADLIVLGISMT